MHEDGHMTIGIRQGEQRAPVALVAAAAPIDAEAVAHAYVEVGGGAGPKIGCLAGGKGKRLPKQWPFDGTCVQGEHSIHSHTQTLPSVIITVATLSMSQSNQVK